MKRILALMMAALLVIGMSTMSFASGTTAESDGNTATHTITINGGRDGEDYAAYKVFDVTLANPAGNSGDPANGFSYTIDSDGDGAWCWSHLISGLTADANGVYTNSTYGLTFTPSASDNTVYIVENSNMDETKAAALAAALNTLTLPATPDGSITNYSSSNKTMTGLDLGYYFVTTTLGAVCSLDTTNEDVTINEKNDDTTLDKTVQEDSTSSYGDKNDADFGQTVNFKSVITIKPHQKDVVFHDILNTSVFDIDWSSITVDPAANATIRTPAADATHSDLPTAAQDTAGKYTGDTFAVDFASAWTEGLTSDTTVTITYSATLKTDATVGDQSGVAMGSGNDNKASVTFGDAQRTTWDWTRTYTWELPISKYTSSSETKARTEYVDDAAAAADGFVPNTDPTATDANYYIKTTNTPLAGAKFNVKKGATVLEFVLDTAGTASAPTVYRLAVASDAAADKVTDLVTPASGLISIKGLDADTYTVAEIEAPAGYNKLASDITVVLDSNTDTAQGTDGTSQAATIALTQDGSAANEVGIENNSGTELPSTGGIGTTIFYIIGGLMVAGAAVLLITKKRMSKE